MMIWDLACLIECCAFDGLEETLNGVEDLCRIILSFKFLLSDCFMPTFCSEVFWYLISLLNW